jgi:iron complex transport system substrate-binding protein
MIMRGTKVIGRVLVALLFVLFPQIAHPDDSAKPRVVSLDFCADQYVLALADRDQIMALSQTALTEYEGLTEGAEGLPTIRATVEDVLLADTDLVVRQWGGGYRSVEALARFGVPVAQIAYGETVESAWQNLRNLGDALGQRARAESMIADLMARLDRTGKEDAVPRRALYLTTSGFTSGSNTFVDSIIAATGLVNIGAENGREGWYPVNLEQIVLDPPEVIIAGFFDLRASNTNHWSITRHGVLRELMKDTPTVMVPSQMIACSTWRFVDAVELIDKTLRPDAAGVTGSVALFGDGR